MGCVGWLVIGLGVDLVSPTHPVGFGMLAEPGKVALARARRMGSTYCS